MKHRPRTRLDLIHPSLQQRVLRKQEYDVQRHNERAQDRTFYTGDSVWEVNFQGSPKWMKGVLEQQLGPVSFGVRLPDGRLWRRHQDHIRVRRPEESEGTQAPVATTSGARLDDPLPGAPQMVNETVPESMSTSVPRPASVEPHMAIVPHSAKVPQGETVPNVPKSPGILPNSPNLRRSSRLSKPPMKLDL